MLDDEQKLEAPVVKNILKEASCIGSRLFRNNRGMFKTLDGKRKVRAGLEAPGASDCVGFYPVVITPEMVGMTLAVFLAAEVKKPDWKYTGDEHEKTQLNFIEKIKEFGGIAFFINNHEDLTKKIADCLKNMVDRNNSNV